MHGDRGLKQTEENMATDVRDMQQNMYDETAKARRVIPVDATGATYKSIRRYENLAGSAGTGSDGDANRVYTLASTYAVEIVEVYLDGVLLVNTTQYTVVNATKKVTILLNVFDTQTVTVVYYI